jgi:putative flippase GtrA
MYATEQKPKLLLVLPGLNEEKQLEKSARSLFGYCTEHLNADYDWRIVLADSGSTDSTPRIIERLVGENDRFIGHREAQKGRGRLLKNVWTNLPFDISIYMDMDLSTELRHIKEAVDAVKNGAALALGSRLKKGARVVGRRLLREITSRGYVLIVNIFGSTRLSDFQCGFKAVSKDLAAAVLPLMQDTNWFFDTEIVLIAEKAGFKIHEVPVHWTDDPGSTVHVGKTIVEDLLGLRRVLGTRPWEKLIPEGRPRPRTLFDFVFQFSKFLVVGGLSTLMNWAVVVLFLLAVPREDLFFLDTVSPPLVVKNYIVGAVLGYVLSAVFNFAVNKRFTFRNRSRAYVKQLSSFFAIALVGLALNTLITALLVERLGVSPFIVTPLAASVVLLWNFTCNKLITFARF